MSANLPQQWLERASEDLAVAHLVLAEEYFAHVCFLAQQCIEKAFKGYLLAITTTYPRTHRLVDLLTECTRHEATFTQFLPDCTIIDQYYTPTRYPDTIAGTGPSGLPGQREAQEAVDAAERILQFVRPLV